MARLPARRKTKFKADDYERLDTVSESDYIEHLGGNALNTITALAAWGHRTRFSGILAHQGDKTSDTLRDHFEAYDIEDYTQEIESYLVSTGIIMRGVDPATGQILDREVRGIPRGKMTEHMTSDVIRDATIGANVIMLASLKEPVLNERVISQAAAMPGVLTSANFGSSEFVDHPRALREVSGVDVLDLTALNETELAQAYNDFETPTDALVARASREMARFVLTTKGKDGVALGHNGDVVTTPIAKIDPKLVIDTLGAGDRAHAIALDALIRGVAPEEIPALVAQGTLKVIQAIGAHGDLKPLRHAIAE